MIDIFSWALCWYAGCRGETANATALESISVLITLLFLFVTQFQVETLELRFQHKAFFEPFVLIKFAKVSLEASHSSANYLVLPTATRSRTPLLRGVIFQLALLFERIFVFTLLKDVLWVYRWDVWSDVWCQACVEENLYEFTWVNDTITIHMRHQELNRVFVEA